jgi:amino acid transporter
VTAVWGWILVSVTNIFVALSMAEIVSSYPIAGGPYFWCAGQFSCLCSLYPRAAWCTLLVMFSLWNASEGMCVDTPCR